MKHAIDETAPRLLFLQSLREISPTCHSSKQQINQTGTCDVRLGGLSVMHLSREYLGKVQAGSMAQWSELVSQSIRAAFKLAGPKPVILHQPPASTR
jgi:hypothetical protein